MSSIIELLIYSFERSILEVVYNAYASLAGIDLDVASDEDEIVLIRDNVDIILNHLAVLKAIAPE